MNINEEVLKDIKEKITCSSKLIRFDSPNKNMRTYCKELIDLTNNHLSSLDKPIRVETENGDLFFLDNARLEYKSFENNELTVSICGDIQSQVSSILETKIYEIIKKET